MQYAIIISIILIGISLFIEANYKKNNENIKENDYLHYMKRNYIMTATELKFYRELKKITDKNNMTIFPQVNMERLIQVKNNEYKYRNKIKSRTIDFTIVSNTNCKIICGIELDDYTHNYKNRIERDKFINELFRNIDLPLIRIKVSNNYDTNSIENKLKELA